MAEQVAAGAASPKLKPREFERIRALARQKFGLNLRPGKEDLVSARLGRKLREGRFASFQAYYDHVVGDRTGGELIALIDALTTNHTSFLREAAHFEFLMKEILPKLRDRRQIRIWCAAAATGEEPYTIAFTLFDFLGPQAGARAKILATDISTRALNKGRKGIYADDRLADLPAEWRRKYFQRGHSANAGCSRVRPEVQAMVDFRRLNLVEGYTHPGPYQVVFCRNVMIYFAPQTKDEVIARLLKWTEPGGYLFVGHSEGLVGMRHALRYVGPAVYRHEPTRDRVPVERVKP